jgi:hypothetical protein
MNAKNDEPEYLTLAKQASFYKSVNQRFVIGTETAPLKAFRLGSRKAMRYKKGRFNKVY